MNFALANSSGNRLVDVLVVTHNHASYVEDALDSVARQVTEFDFQIVIADDSSTDNTVEIISDWISRHPEHPAILLPPQERLGITLNYYRGLSACNSRYIAILEGDDLWIATDKLQRQVEVLENNPNLSLCANRLLVANPDQCWSYIHSPQLSDEFMTELSGKALLQDNFVGSFSACVFRNEFVKLLPPSLFELTAYDWAFCLALSRFGNIGYLPITATMYRQHDSSSWSAKTRAEKLDGLLSLVPEYADFFGGDFETGLIHKLRLLRRESRTLQLNDEPPQDAENLAKLSSPEAPANIPLVSSEPTTVSVLLTSFNRSRFIGEAIQSVLTQSFQDFELIIVDDGSNDDSWNVIESYASSKIRAYRLLANVGAAEALNIALLEARGDYIAVINCDDTWHPEKLERQLAVIVEEDVVAVFTAARFIDENSRPISPRQLPTWFEVFNQKSRTRSGWLEFFFDNGNALCHPSALITRKFFEEKGLYRNWLRQIPDFEMWTRLISHDEIRTLPSFESVNFRLLVAQENASAATPTNATRGFREHVVVIEEMLRNAPEFLIVEAFSSRFILDNAVELGLLRFEIALMCLQSKSSLAPIHYEVGLRLMRELLVSPENKEILRTYYGYSDLAFHHAMGHLIPGSPSYLNPKTGFNMHAISSRHLLSTLWMRLGAVPVWSLPSRIYRLIRWR